MSFIHLQKKIKKKKIGIWIGSGSGSVIPEADPHQNEADPLHWFSFSPILCIDLFINIRISVGTMPFPSPRC